MTFAYDDPSNYYGLTRLTNVVLADHSQFSFRYDDPTDYHRITSVVGPNGRTASFGYSSPLGNSVVLTSITDTVGIVSSFSYDVDNQDFPFPFWWIDAITTPYGTTAFWHVNQWRCDQLQHQLSCQGVDRSITIIEPGGTTQAYAFYDNPHNFTGTNEMAGKIPTAFDASQVPSYGAANDPPVQTLDTTRNMRNSHYWGRQQTELLSTTNIADLVAADFRLSHTKHWLLSTDQYPGLRVMAWELPPSPDGVNELRPIFYDYAGKPAGTDGAWREGTNSLPSVVARRMPDGSAYYRYFERNALGMKTSRLERWEEGITVKTRTNSYYYATGTGDPSIDNLLLLRQQENGAFVFERTMHPTYPDQIGSEKDAGGNTTTFDYYPNRQLKSALSPVGLLSTYTYYPTNDINGPSRLKSIVESKGSALLRTNSFTWLTGNLRQHTDARGLTRTFSFDFLGRLTQIAYPGGSTETFDYVLPAGAGFNGSGNALKVLDLVTYKDRMGNFWRTLPNRNRQVTTVQEPSRSTPGQFGTEHVISYCGCGAPDVIVRGSNSQAPEVTYFNYNYAGLLETISLTNATLFTNRYDVVGRLGVRQDAIGSTTNIYDNLSRVVERRNGAGLIEGIRYNLDDQPTVITNRNGVIVTNSYDDLGRLTTRALPSGGQERWIYQAGYAGETSYTNELGQAILKAYDHWQRLTNEVAAGAYTNKFVYSPAGDLLELYDGKNQRTAWVYDLFGRMLFKTNQSGQLVESNSYDDNSRLASRWTPQKQTTAYFYDRIGNLTFVDYPSSPDISIQYDALSRMTNMVDSAGTNRFSYAIGGALASESSAWPSSALTNIYHPSIPGLLTSMVLEQPSGSWSQNFAYDSAQRLRSIASPAGSFTNTYAGGGSPNGRASLQVAHRSLFGASGPYITNSFDSTGRLRETMLRTSSHLEQNRHTYGYDLASQRTNQTRFDGSTVSTVNYTYDPIGQLRSATGSEQLGYRYDEAFNLAARTNASVVESFGVNVRNELTTLPFGGAAVYDLNGNLTWDGERTLGYDDENQLTSITDGASFHTEFVYDGLGRLRVRREYPGGSGGSGAARAAALPMITNQTLSATLRNDVSGWVGLRLQAGSSNLVVTELGRWVLSGNSGLHTVKLVTSAGADLAAVTVSTLGKTTNAYAYGALATPVTLTNNQTYYLLSQEAWNGDRWHEWNTPLTTRAGATVLGAAYNVGSGYVNGAAGSYGYGPVNLKFAAAESSGPPLVTGVTLGTSRNNHSGWVGFKFTVGAAPIAIGELGRWVASGNSGSHVVKLVTAAGTDLSGASVTVNTLGAPAGQFKYAPLASPVTLAANTTYSLVSQEIYGGDTWHDANTAIVTGSGLTQNNAVWANNNSTSFNNAGVAGYSYGPVSMRQTAAAGGAGALLAETRYLYMGRLVLQERDANNTPTVSYTRGWDLSGSFKGAGGIGGLVARSSGYSGGAWAEHHAYHADGSGNITALIAANQAVSARYRYDPFGNLLSTSGTALAQANTHRFSSKEQMLKSGIYYYGFRFYDPYFQRWLTQDPIRELGGINLFRFVLGNPLSEVDRNGLDVWVIKDETGWGHETVVGSNPDGTCWQSDMFPGRTFLNPALSPALNLLFGPIRTDPLLAKPDIRFDEQSPLNPGKGRLPKDSRIIKHIKTTPKTDALIKSMGRKSAEEDSGIYIPGLNDCRHYADWLTSPIFLAPNDKTIIPEPCPECAK